MGGLAGTAARLFPSGRENDVKTSLTEACGNVSQAKMFRLPEIVP
jgi:hypothetical protein